ncbi:MAG: sodium:solute symporter [Flavobacteriaceae bacterium]|jgi:Na+/proline symporter|nr:sodium:solute symporter [Flavobacteriaceae bacterium]
MNITLLLLIIFAYFLVLLALAYFTSKNSNNQSFFIGNRKSKWWLVAFGMIGTSLSGVTFISVPGTVGKLGADYPFGGFEYFMLVIGNFLGYFLVAFLLLPLYYRMNLTSIYTYLGRRFNTEAHQTGSIFFIISRCIGATARLYLVINVLQIFLLNRIGIPFWLTTAVILLMIVLYTFEGGVKTIVFTDTLQTSFMLISLIVCIAYILSQMDISVGNAYQIMEQKDYARFLNLDFTSKTFFLKSVLGGMFITIAMTGLDQEMMQKNISVKNLRDSKKNMLTFSFISLIVNFLFLFLGGLLYLYAQQAGGAYADGGFFMPKNAPSVMGDDLFPALSLNGYFPMTISVIFIIGLVSALFPSADGALTAVTSSFCIDLLGLNKTESQNGEEEKRKKRTRISIHLIFTVIFFLLIMIFKWINEKSIVYLIMEVAGYTYGPLLGLFAFGIFTKRVINLKKGIIITALLAPILTWLINYATSNFGYKFGVELIIFNGLLTFIGLWLISQKSNINSEKS